MKLNAIQVAGLQALSAILDEVPSAERTLPPALKLAFTQGTHYGRAALARELLQAEQDGQLGSRPGAVAGEFDGREFLRHAGMGSKMSGGSAASDCVADTMGSVHLCNCGECTDYRNRL